MQIKMKLHVQYRSQAQKSKKDQDKLLCPIILLGFCVTKEAEEMGNPHVVVIPYPAQGHVIPLMELSLCLAEHGLKTTFVNTHYHHKLMTDALASKKCHIGDGIHLVSVSDGLDSAEDRKNPGKMSEAILKVIPGEVEKLIGKINETDSDEITCVLADQSLGWALEIAHNKGIKCAAFCPAAAAMLVLAISIPKLIAEGTIDTNGTPIKKEMIKLSTGMPPMSTSKLVWANIGNKDTEKNIFKLMQRNNQSMKLAEWLICNSSYELEPAALTLDSTILPIGPLLASNRVGGHSAGNLWAEDSSCLKWLDQQKPASVIYIAFGSFTVFNPTQLQELALGLELSNHPFLWVIADGKCPQGFRERVGARGKMMGWAPQQKVLTHPSIACFISHCGWNSTMEGVCNGTPFLCWPYFADQFFNETYICDVWKVGLGFGRNKSGVITRDEIKNKVERLLGDRQLKDNALQLMKVVKASAKQGGSSNTNFTNFVKWIKA